MNRFSKSYHARQRKAKAQKNRSQALPYTVIVYDKTAENPCFSMVEKKSFSSYESAQDYCKIYENSEKLGAYIQ